VAAHKDRKLVAVVTPEANGASHRGASARAAEAAARVAARYAKVPSYSDVLAGDARAAVRAAEAASRAAQEAHAAAESVLAGIEAANAAEQVWEVRTSEILAVEPELDDDAMQAQAEATEPGAVTPRAQWASEMEEFEQRWEREFPERPIETAGTTAVRGVALETGIETGTALKISETGLGNLREPVWTAPERLESDEIEMVEPAQPIHANLIEFPREIVATRKVRPRLAEGPLAETEDQLSIFEVDPSTVSTELMAAAATEAAAPGWSAPDWSGIELDATPASEFYETPPSQPVAETVVEKKPAAKAIPYRMTLEAVAPLQLRMMAAMVDGSLVVCALLGAALVAGASVREVPSLRVTEASAAIGLALICAFYHFLFYGFAHGTPGMRYAGILPCSFSGRRLSRWQRFGRLAAMVLSVAPLGMGVAWASIDDESLSWHDRLSGTYLRKC